MRVGNAELDNGNFVVPEADELDGRQRDQPAARGDAADRAPRRVARHRCRVQGGADPAPREARGAQGRWHRRLAGRARVDEGEGGRQRGADAGRAARDARRARGAREVAVARVPQSADAARLARARSRAISSAAGTSRPRARASPIRGARAACVISASGQADDGQSLHEYFLRYGHTAKDLPNDKELGDESKRLDHVNRGAGEGAGRHALQRPDAVRGRGRGRHRARNTLAPHLGGTPVPEGLSPQEAKTFGGAARRQDRRARDADDAAVIDDPTAREGGGKALIGGYKIDDEGVAAQKVEVVKDGVLKTLLTVAHAFGEGPDLERPRAAARRRHRRCVPRQRDEPVHVGARAALAQGARAAADRGRAGEGKKYGLIIRRFDDAAITGAPEFTRRELVQMIKAPISSCRRRRRSRTGCIPTARKSSCAACSSPRFRSGRGRT